jgi:hypothetical protein
LYAGEVARRFSERFTRKQRIAVGLLAALELAAKLAALRDIQRRSPEQLRGSKTFWRLAQLVNTLGPLGYFLFARRES